MSIKLEHRGREMDITVEDVVEHGHATKGGVVSWKNGVYDESIRYHVKKVGNDKKLKVSFTSFGALTPTMKKELPDKILQAIKGKLGNEGDLYKLV